MARIDINSVDLESLNDRMKKIKSKISEAQDVLNGSFTNERALKLYTEGFRKLNTFFNNTDESFLNSVRNVSEYTDAFRSIEESYRSKFNSINAPTFKATGVVKASSVKLYDNYDTTVNAAASLVDTMKKGNNSNISGVIKPIYSEGKLVDLYDMSKANELKIEPIAFDYKTKNGEFSVKEEPTQPNSILGNQANMIYNQIQNNEKQYYETDTFNLNQTVLNNYRKMLEAEQKDGDN